MRSATHHLQPPRRSARHLASALLPLLGLACAEAPAAVELVPDTVWAVPTEPAAVSAYIVRTGAASAVLIDSGAEADATSLRDTLDAIGIAPGAVSDIFVTHGHADHLAGVGAFPNSTLRALADEAALIAGEAKSPRPLPSFGDPEPTGLRIDAVVADGDTVVVGTRQVEVFHVPGHTAGHAVYLAAGVLFLGDAAMASDDGRLDNALWLFSSDVDQNLDALRALHARLEPRAGEIEVLAAAHSTPLRDGLAPLTELIEREAD